MAIEYLESPRSSRSEAVCLLKAAQSSKAKQRRQQRKDLKLVELHLKDQSLDYQDLEDHGKKDQNQGDLETERA